jgi:hypothetical protein
VQKLHLVGFTTEHDGLVFSARKGSKAGGYIITLDKELLSTIAEAERLRNGQKSESGGDDGARQRRADSRLTPREIQAHLRAGRSIPEVAAEAGVDPEWVERFAVPIVAEQAQMVERAQAMTFSKQRLGQSTQPLGTSVRWNLADKGVGISQETFDEGWSAFQLQDEVWMVRFRYTSRARLQVAEWELDLGRNLLTSRNRLASELGYVEKGRRPPALPAPPPRVAAAPPVRVVEEVVEEPEPDPQPEPPAPPPAPRRRPATRRSTRARTSTARKKKKATARKKPATKKAPARKATAKKPAKKKSTRPSKSTAKRPAARKATTKKAAKKSPRKAVTRSRSTRRPAAKKATARRTPPRRAPATTRRPVEASAPAPTRRPVTKERPVTRQRPVTVHEAAPERPRRPVRAERPIAARPAEPEPDFESEALDVPEAPAPRPAARKARTQQAGRPRIAAASAKEAASKRSGHGAVRRPPAASASRPVRRSSQPAKAQRQAKKTAPAADPATPNLSGPLARSLLARRLMARKAAPSNGGQQANRPLRVK